VKIYIGLAVADSMFPETCHVDRRPCPLPLAMKLLRPPTEEGDTSEVINCCNSSHAATLTALKVRYDIDLAPTIPATPPKVALVSGDVLVVLSVRGLPRLTDRHEYTPAEIEAATFSFGLWTVH
jgi:hypothetical protein